WLFAGLALAPPVVRAQAPAAAVISGTVLDQEDHQPLPNARVGVYRLDNADSGWTAVAGSLSAADGTYRFTVPPGKYRLIFSYQTYSTSVIDDVVVAAGETKEILATLTPKPLEIKGVEIKGSEARGSEATSLTKQKKAPYVSDAITSEQISKSTDSNAAEALERVTGLSVVEGKYVFVRGLGERYSSTQVNGSTVGTPEPNKRVVPLDVFPSGALDNVVVQKSYTPDQDAEFGGGVVQLNTKDFVEGESLTQSMSAGVTGNSLRRGYLSYPGGRFDFLGFDDGTRSLPSLVEQLAGDHRITQKSAFSNDGLDAGQIQALGRSFDKTWSPRSGGARPNYSYAASYSRGLKLLGRETGFLASFSLSNSFTNESSVQNEYAGSRTSLTPLYEYKVESSNASVLGGVLTNLSVKLAPSQTIRVRTLYTRSADNEARISQGPNEDYGTQEFRVTRLGYVERGLLSNVVSGDHRVAFLHGLLADWNFGYSSATRGEPSRRESAYESNGNGQLVLSQRNQYGLTRVFGAMKELDRSLHGNLSMPWHAWGGGEAKVKAGVAWRLRGRVSSFRRFGFALGPLGASTLDLSLPPDELLADENIQPGYFTLNELTRENDQYTAHQELRAAYSMIDLPLPGRLRLVGGARIESSDQAVQAKSPFVTNAVQTDVRLKNDEVLPAVNLTYAATERMNVRAGFSKTVSRPELREMSPFDIYDYETGFTEIGNPQIQATPLHNYDLRWEFYPGPRELLAVSGFHKDIDRPIESFVKGSSGGYILMPENGQNGRLTGVELEARMGLPALTHWALNLNYSRVKSSVRVQISTDAAGNPIYRTGPLGGQSTYALNAGLYYADATYDGSLLLSGFGERLAEVGAGQYPNSLPDIYEHPMKALDLSVGRKLGDALRVKLAAENLLDGKTQFIQLDKITRFHQPGRAFSLGLQWKQ
ncbi:MAG TPA: TonB-dependent receptor, partial [Candidatus Binatia bacterium]|nr:TonB-dependent receptor [Candidatus Binatia bacterium]